MITNKLKLADAQALIAEFKQSKLKPGAFCARKNIPYHVLKYWRDRCSKKSVSAEPANAKFLPVKILGQPATMAPPIKIIIGDNLCVEVPDGFDLRQLKRVLEVCKSCG